MFVALAIGVALFGVVTTATVHYMTQESAEFCMFLISAYILMSTELFIAGWVLSRRARQELSHINKIVLQPNISVILVSGPFNGRKILCN